MTAREIPHNIEAEESLLGACLLSRYAMESAAAVVVPEDFYKPAHQTIYAALLDLMRQGVQPDPTTVSDELRRSGDLAAIGGAGTLVGLQAGTPTTTGAGKYAQIVLDYAIRRRLLGAVSEMTTLAYDTAVELPDALDSARSLLGTIELPVGQSEPDANLDEFIDAAPDEPDWLVPGLLERRDRMVIVGPEGYGKSTLLRQMAVTMSQGIHPFTFRRIPAVNVVYVDLENPANLIRRKLHPMRAQARLTAGPSYNPDTFRMVTRDGGIDVTKRADAYWLMDKVAANVPDVVFIGPLYQTYVESPNEETVVRKVTNLLDMIRTRFDVALCMETHAPHGAAGKRAWRPVGSSLWLRWPEFILGLDPDAEDDTSCRVEYGKYPRDEREFPKTLTKGGRWPWTTMGVQ